MVSCSSKASNISLSSSETFSFLTLSFTVLIQQFRQRVGPGSDVLRVVPLSSLCGLIRSCDAQRCKSEAANKLSRASDSVSRGIHRSGLGGVGKELHWSFGRQEGLTFTRAC